MSIEIHNQPTASAFNPQVLPPRATPLVVIEPLPSTPTSSRLEIIDADSAMASRVATVEEPFNLAPMQPLRAFPPADEAAIPIGLERFPYGSGEVPLVPTPAEAVHLNGGVGTRPEVAQLADAGVANVFSPEWQALLGEAVAQNGGLGESENGYLAFSREFGWVRFKHPGFSPEQNRRIAGMSLQSGWPIERLPGRNLGDSSFQDPKVNDWVDGFIAKFDEELTQFLANPQDELLVKDGSRNRYLMKFDAESNRVFSAAIRKKGGFAGIAEKNIESLAPILDIATVATAVMGMPYLSAGIQTAKQGLVSAATGKFSANQGIAIATSWLTGPMATTQLGKLLATPGGRAALSLGTDLADDGKISASTITGVVGPQLLTGLPGGPVVDRALQQTAKLAAMKADGRDVGLTEIYQVLRPVLEGMAASGNGREIVAGLNGSVTQGPATQTESWEGLLSFLSDDPADIKLMSGGLAILAGYIDDGRIDTKTALSLMKDYFEPELDAIKAAIKEELGQLIGG